VSRLRLKHAGRQRSNNEHASPPKRRLGGRPRKPRVSRLRHAGRQRRKSEHASPPKRRLDGRPRKPRVSRLRLEHAGRQRRLYGGSLVRERALPSTAHRPEDRHQRDNRRRPATGGPAATSQG